MTVALQAGFLDSANRHPDRPALGVGGRTWSYGQLHEAVAEIASVLQMSGPERSPCRVGVFAHRSATLYAGILGALCAGHTYVPLNRTFPVSRTRLMLERAQCEFLIVDAASSHQLDEVLEGLGARLTVLMRESDDVANVAARWPQHRFVGRSDLAVRAGWNRAGVDQDQPAYLLFTSGTTGTPKGVAVTHGNARHFIRTVLERYPATADDRFSQMFDATFDLSVFDLFVAWAASASVHCPSDVDLMAPARYIQEAGITVWASVPSMAGMMKRLGSLKAGRFPGVRWTVFCGEPLLGDLAQAWAQAAPGTVVDNLYGPTELTVACTAYRWDRDSSPAASRLGIVPIGYPNPEMHALVVDEACREVDAGEVGELLVSGPQVTPGYWQDPATTAARYVRVTGHSGRYYRTGDRVRRPIGDEPLTFVGRDDHQVKVRGFRVELGEVESLLREERGVESAVALAWPPLDGSAGGIVAFLTGRDLDTGAIQQRMQQKLQAHAVPRTIYVIPELPYTANGKVDRQALLSRL